LFTGTGGNDDDEDDEVDVDDSLNGGVEDLVLAVVREVDLFGGPESFGIPRTKAESAREAADLVPAPRGGSGSSAGSLSSLGTAGVGISFCFG
jgi:hypothetical protein